ncbi:hypothetical protein P153DRAFT_383529 [Dothidotthia symphoricarpi CBS 119687]|uniref:Arrestin-like N-terminal domain-containing protein n=1 Tax=Dothidotthia symphoricarpi CBS 119687 TaxID=1392245 RepID=A0A6A6ALS2_9PLEO|nr:uncharacterized protein P153DRAFT_383529 [Dothidotthia symphoricarpi CBS 119687]KAF2131421.1 hypothetical protein P153DRAFT_383529 [Dothidotthia symphoricarpi CBS 119687]
MVLPSLRVIIDGDGNKVYSRGDKVTGRIVCVAEEQEHVESLKVVLTGSCVTKTTRSFFSVGSDISDQLRRDYEERICLFNHEQELVPRSTLRPNKYSWTFEFTFPELTEPHYKRVVHGANYLRRPHPLPPSFQLQTSVPGGAAQVVYSVQAKLKLGGSKGSRRAKHILQYQPKPPGDASRDIQTFSSALYGQTWKPTTAEEDAKPTVNKVFTKVSGRSSSKTEPAPRIVPIISYPERVAPGHHIPLELKLINTRDPLNEAQSECTLDSLSVTLSTYSTSMCGNSSTQPEDIVLKHVPCIARTNMNKSVLFGTAQALTNNFRLVTDTECVPTFKTYTITRRYTLSISIGIKYADQRSTIHFTTPLEILPPRPHRLLPPPLEEGDEIDPLPLYMPRELDMECAPDYELVCALSRTSSASASSTLSRSTSSSFNSGAGTPSTSSSTPDEKMKQPVFRHEEA